MFGKKKKSAKPRLALYGARGEAVFDDMLTALSVPDATVKSLSARYFDDPNPCEIHRSAVLSRVFMELEEALPENEKIPVASLDGEKKEYLSGYAAVWVKRYTDEGGRS